MRFYEIVVAGAGLVSSAFAVTIDTYPNGGVEAGKSYTITYSPKDQPATLILRKGLSTDLATIATIGTGQAGSFTWNVPSTLPNGADYALQITQGSEINYSGQFGLTGGSSAVSSAALSSATSASGATTSTVAVTSSTTQGSTVIVTRSTSVASASIIPSAGLNSTVSVPTLSRTPSATASRPASTTGGNPPESTGAAAMLSASPFAAILGAIAAFAYLA
ncbi:Ser-Thr-rich glycosyl-phosphatidyl-inositol-anchored membrane family-domain-containing protein [Ampelomyces quisqualis]|uniref:Ser-Thr-rich glycosyl-phosphatidyl-inositol-anchored membrane family-domain-containing protein n=1 Tax=Ampelomyces quisqualis TaxID=50730 RepID=A0A6A5Q9S3_AMPQU|nr:Ser-Thr-rich glycosyl-phosphatidyl-inositol-anchored membrane family-domain-containing protein [Ampelomyces quisqualis]